MDTLERNELPPIVTILILGTTKPEYHGPLLVTLTPSFPGAPVSPLDAISCQSASVPGSEDEPFLFRHAHVLPLYVTLS